MKKTVFTLVVLVFCLTGFSQTTNERLSFAGSYRMGGMMTNFAQVSLQTNPVKTSKKTYIHLALVVQTYSKWDRFFKIRDFYESYVDQATARPGLFKRNILEGKYSKAEKYLYQSNGRVNATIRNKRGATRTKTFGAGGAMDIVAAIYKLRSCNFSRMKPGQAVGVTVLFDEKGYPASARYVGKEVISAGCLGKRVCYKLSIAARTNKLRGRDQNLIWLTADNRQIPVLIKFSIPVGLGQLVLTSVH